MTFLSMAEFLRNAGARRNENVDYWQMNFVVCNDRFSTKRERGDATKMLTMADEFPVLFADFLQDTGGRRSENGDF